MLIMDRFASLPKPKETDWEFELPEEQHETDANLELSEEDAAERDRRNREIREAAERAELKRRTQVLQRDLPRPSVVDVDSLLLRASHIPNLVDRAIAHEMALLIANDALRYPAPGTKVNGSSIPLESFDDEALNTARLEIACEMPPDAAGKGAEEFEAAWLELHGSTKLPGLGGYGEDEIDEHQLMVEAFDVCSKCTSVPCVMRHADTPQNIQDSIVAAAEKGNKIESKLALHLGGYQQRAKTLRNKIVEAGEALDKAKIELDTFQTLQIAEEAAIPRRLEALREEVSFVSRREREAQELFRARKEELEGLIGGKTNGVH